jgi:lipopolysaccharide biosynthesis glycosyltransferase
MVRVDGRMKHYMACNESIFLQPKYKDHLQVSVASSLRKGMTPHIIYDGQENQETRDLQRIGAKIIPHRVTFYDALVEFAEEAKFSLDIAQGAYLRFDVPLLEREDEFVLYTDCDIMVQRPAHLEAIRPDLIACSPEVGFENWHHFNSGVMVINVPAMRTRYDSIVNFMIERRFQHKYPSYDQGALIDYMGDKWTKLDQVYNWKPYWGKNPWAVFVHWHGPKYEMARRFLSGEESVAVEHASHLRLFKMDEEAYNYYCDLFDDNLRNYKARLAKVS